MRTKTKSPKKFREFLCVPWTTTENVYRITEIPSIPGFDRLNGAEIIARENLNGCGLPPILLTGNINLFIVKCNIGVGAYGN